MATPAQITTSRLVVDDDPVFDAHASDISVLDMFTVGIGPSSSHTVGPMKAAAHAVREIDARGLLPMVCSVAVTLYGSLAATGIGHGTPDAVIAGLEGLDPQDCDPDAVHGRWSALTEEARDHPRWSTRGSHGARRHRPARERTQTAAHQRRRDRLPRSARRHAVSRSRLLHRRRIRRPRRRGAATQPPTRLAVLRHRKRTTRGLRGRAGRHRRGRDAK